MMISSKLYKKIISVLPIICVDIVVKHKGKFLLVKRKNAPEKGKWWVPGGRILKGETAHQAVKRKAKEELGINVKIIKSLGYFEKSFSQNNFGSKGGVHTLSIIFLAKPLSMNIKLDSQSSGWRLFESLPKGFKIKN